MGAIVVGNGREGGAEVVIGAESVELACVLLELGRFELVSEVGLDIHVVGVAIQSEG